MSPISTLYHIAPCCFVFLALPFTYIEFPKMLADPNLNLNIPLLLLSACTAFGEWDAVSTDQPAVESSNLPYSIW
jgi:hypothetical protein